MKEEIIEIETERTISQNFIDIGQEFFNEQVNINPLPIQIIENEDNGLVLLAIHPSMKNKVIQAIREIG